MTERQKKKYSKMIHQHSPSVASLSIKKVPSYVQNEIPKEVYNQALHTPILDTSQGFLILNEDYELFETQKTILVALDWLPRALLQDVYQMEKERFKDIDFDNPWKLEDEKEHMRSAYVPLMKALLDAQDPSKHI